jgi:DNA-directed RNA polymerase II subunit RPB1
MVEDYSYYSEIQNIEFYVLGSEENFIDSSVSVTNKELFKGDLPVNNGVYAPNMGTTSYDWNCSSCFLGKGFCSSHSGSIDLRFPVKSPLFRESILKWLKIICFSCGRLLINKDINVASSRLLIEYVKLAKGVDKCPHSDCGAIHPNISKDKFEQNTFYAEYKSGNFTKKEELYNHLIREIFGRISNETVRKMQKSENSHPKNFILDIIRVAPNAIRPDIRKVGGSRSNNSDITALTKNIVEINELLPLEIPDLNEISKELREMYFNLDITYYEMIKGSSATNNQVRLVTATNKVPSSIASRIPKKTGRVRRNLLGKRTRYMLRSVNGYGRQQVTAL